MIRNGITYPDGTPELLIKALEEARQSGIRPGNRIRLFLGNPETGENWLEEHDVIGYVGNSMGPTKVPLLIYNAASLGGSAILVKSVLAVLSPTKGWMYKHPKFKAPQFAVSSKDLPAGYHMGVDHLKRNGSLERAANFKSIPSAYRYIDFMTGKRFSK